jgi:hypothetical protein
MSEYKQFSKKLYDENDQIAKEVALDFLISTGYYKLEIPLKEQKEQYKKQDFEVILISKNKKVSVEVERKKVWTKSGKWQGWSTIDVPTRKNQSKAKLYVMINNPGDTIAITKMKNVLNADISTKKTIYTDNEDFFNVELDKFKFYHKKNGIWENLKKK